MATGKVRVWCRSHKYTWPEQVLGCGAVFHMTRTREGENRELGCHPSATLKPGKSHLDTAPEDPLFREDWAARPVLKLAASGAVGTAPRRVNSGG